MKKYNQLRNYEIRPFDRTRDFAKLLTLFIKIQEKIEIKTYSALFKNQSSHFIYSFMIEELHSVIKKSVYIDVFYDLDTNEPMGASFYHAIKPNALNSRVKISGDLYLPFAFMDPSYKFTPIVSKGFLKSIALTSKKANNARVFSVFGERNKMNNYLKFLKKIFHCKIIKSHDSFNKHLAEWPTNYEN